MTHEPHLDVLLNEAKNNPPPLPSNDLIARVLADAAAQSTAQITTATSKKPGLLARILAPIGGFGGAAALGACTAIGLLVGTNYADTTLSIPVFDDVVAVFSNSTDTTTPFETLSLLMAES